MVKRRVTVLARLRAREGKELELKQALLALLSPTRAEEGCINYDLHQSAADKALFLFYENWASAEALDRHSRSAHIRAMGEQAEDLLAEPVEITLWEIMER